MTRLVTSLGCVALLAGCPAAPADSDTDVAPTGFPWASAWKRYANCALEKRYYGEHQEDVAATERQEFDDNGLWIHQEYYDVWYADGDLTGVSDRDIDAQGRVLSTTWTNPARDEVDYVQENTWDDAGQVSGTGTSPSGVFPEMVWTFVHDDRGRTVSESADYAPYDGVPDEVWTHEYSDSNPSTAGPFEDWRADRTTGTIGDWGEEVVLDIDPSGNILHRDTVVTGPNAVKAYCDYENDDAGRVSRYACDCPEPCWKWSYTEVLFDWTCPEDAP